MGTYLIILFIFASAWLGAKFGVPYLRAKAYSSKRSGQDAAAAPSIPELTDKELTLSKEAIEWCESQIGDYLNAEPQPFPNYGPLHDIRVAAYICGFIHGLSLARRTMETWGDGNKTIITLGYMAVICPAISKVLGLDRSLEVIAHLPQLSSATMTKDIETLDKAGGTDGFHHANGEPKQFGGLLRHYLAHNIRS